MIDIPEDYEPEEDFLPPYDEEVRHRRRQREEALERALDAADYWRDFERDERLLRSKDK